VNNNKSDFEYTLMPPEHLFPLTRHFSHYITPVLLRYPVTPNQVTILSLITGVSGGVCFLFGQWGWNVLGALLLVLSYTLDNCDGEIARAKNLFSPLGAKLDDTSDSLVDGVFFAMLGFGTTAATGEPVWAWFGMAVVVAVVIDYSICISRRKQGNKAKDTSPVQEDSTKAPHDIKGRLFYMLKSISHNEFCNIVLILALLDVAWVLLPLAAAGAQVYWIMALFSKGRKK